MKENGRKQNFIKILLQKYISALLAVFVFVTGMLAGSVGEAVTSSDSVSGKLLDNKGIASMNVKLQNIDLKRYEFYNPLMFIDDNDLKGSKLGKSSPGAKIIITVKPTSNYRVDKTWVSFQAKKIQKGFPNYGQPIDLNGNSGTYVIPKGVEMVYVGAGVNYHDSNAGNFGLAHRSYFIFTSDDAFKRAYEIYTGAKLAGPVKVSDDKSTKESSKPNNKQSTSVQSKKDDSGSGFGIVEIGGGLVLITIGGYIGLQFLGGGVGGTTAGEAGAGVASDLPSVESDVSAEPPVPPAPKEYLYTDPAGFQTLYVQDPETGQWTNFETGNPVDMDSLKEYDRQRMQDMAWSHNETQKLADRTTAFDNDMKQDYQRMLEEEARIQEQTKRDMMAIKTSTYGMTDAERKAVLESRQAERVKDQEAAERKAKVLDTAVKTLEVVEKGADLSISVLSTVTPGGNLVANIYTGVKNVTVGGMQAAVEGKSITGGIVKGIAKGGADIVQNMAGGKWTQKLATYVGSEALKEGIVAGIDGENVVKETFKGAMQGLSKFGVDKIGSTISGKIGAKNDLAMKDKYFKIKNDWSKTLKPKSVKAVRELNFQRYFAKEQSRLLQQGIGQTLANEASARSYEMGVEGKSFTESTFGDKW